MSKTLSRQSSGENQKRTQQGVSAKSECYIYKVHMVHATNNYACPYVHTTILCLPHFLLKATMLSLCILTLPSRPFYYILGLWCHIIWPVMWLLCHVPLHCPKEKQKKRNIKSRKIDKRKRKMLVSKAFHNTYGISVKERMW